MSLLIAPTIVDRTDLALVHGSVEQGAVPLRSAHGRFSLRGASLHLSQLRADLEPRESSGVDEVEHFGFAVQETRLPCLVETAPAEWPEGGGDFAAAQPL